MGNHLDIDDLKSLAAKLNAKLDAIDSRIETMEKASADLAKLAAEIESTKADLLALSTKYESPAVNAAACSGSCAKVSPPSEAAELTAIDASAPAIV